MLREIAHYATLLVGALFSVVVAVFGMSLSVISSRLKQLDLELQTEAKDLIGQISDLSQASQGEPNLLISQASAAISKVKRRSRRIRFNRWLLSLWGALYTPSLLLLSAFVMFMFTKIGIPGGWEILVFSVAVIFTVYSLMHLALVVELVHKAVLLPEPPAESIEELGPELDLEFFDRSTVKVIDKSSDFPLEFIFLNNGQGQAENASISVFVPNTFTHISGSMVPQTEGELDGLNAYRYIHGKPLESETSGKVTIGTVKTPAEPGNFKFHVRLRSANSRIVKKSLQVLVQ